MFCPNCGSPVAESANFCSKCGTRILREDPLRQQTTHSHNNYTMYEVFDSTNAASSKINGLFDRLLKTQDSPTTLNRFTLTDRSIITDLGEIPYERMTVLAPSGITRQLFGEGFSAGAVYTTIDGKRYCLHHTMQDATRFYLTAIYANEKISKTSKRQLMQCMCMYYAYLLNANALLHKLPVKFEGELSEEESRLHFENFFSNIYNGEENAKGIFPDATPPAAGKEPFDEFIVCNARITVNDNAVLNPENQCLVDTYTEIQEKFNQFLKENNPIPNAGQNRSPYTLGPLIDLMEDSDPDASAAIAKYNEQVRREKERAAAEAARRRESGGSYSQESSHRPSRYEQKRMEREEIERERRRQEALKKNYYNTPKCQRYGLNGKNSCAGCPIAHACKH